jgi:trehalose-6-phosphatase
VISGRTLHNLIRKVRLEGIIYGGNRHLSLSTMPQNVMPVYIGDDTTDEDAFAAIGQNGFTVVVGNSHRSAAQNSPRNTDEVFKLLEKMFLLRDQ